VHWYSQLTELSVAVHVCAPPALHVLPADTTASQFFPRCPGALSDVASSAASAASQWQCSRSTASMVIACSRRRSGTSSSGWQHSICFGSTRLHRIDGTGVLTHLSGGAAAETSETVPSGSVTLRLVRAARCEASLAQHVAS